MSVSVSERARPASRRSSSFLGECRESANKAPERREIGEKERRAAEFLGGKTFASTLTARVASCERDVCDAIFKTTKRFLGARPAREMLAVRPPSGPTADATCLAPALLATG